MTLTHLETGMADYSQIFACGLEALDNVQILQPGAVLVYVHLPKAAGNSSIRPLRDRFPPYVSVNWRKPKEHVEEIVASWEEQPVNFISGHMNHGVLQILRNSSLPHSCLTFIRHPVERIISSYRYGTSAKAPGAEALLQRFPTLEHFIFESVKTNEISRFMLGKNVRSLEEYKAGMKSYAFVGVSELLPLCHLMLSRMLKIPFELPGRANVTDNPTVSPNVSQQALDYLYTTQQMDVMFHAYLLDQFCRFSSAMIGKSAHCCSENGGGPQCG